MFQEDLHRAPVVTAVVGKRRSVNGDGKLVSPFPADATGAGHPGAVRFAFGIMVDEDVEDHIKLVLLQEL